MFSSKRREKAISEEWRAFGKKSKEIMEEINQDYRGLLGG